jgi:hypothetical protein
MIRLIFIVVTIATFLKLLRVKFDYSDNKLYLWWTNPKTKERKWVRLL